MELEEKLALETAGDFCREAARLVDGPRAAVNGDKTINFKNIATLWTAYLAISKPYRNELSAKDVGCMMELFKIARRSSGSYNPDDYVDAAGYAGCTGEIAAQMDKEK